MTDQRLSPGAALLLGGLVVGSLDIAYAMTFWALRSGVAPSRILQSVAAGVLGPAAASRGGLSSALLGAVLHYFIAFVIVVVYWVLSRFVPLLIQRPVACGSAYGVLVYVVMNFVVIPLSAARRGSSLLIWVICSIIVHAFLVGVPAALFSRVARDRSLHRVRFTTG